MYDGPNETAAVTTAQAQSPAQEFRLPRGPRILSLFATVFIGLVSAFLAGAAIVAFGRHWGLGLFMGAVACFCAGLTAYVWRDYRGKAGLRIVLDRDAVRLDLPAGRSLIHRLPAQRLIVPYAEIAAVETRLEAYRSFGMANMQRAYALRGRNGDVAFLFEDRALATGLATTFFGDVANRLAERAGVPLRDLGMVEGRGGFLAVWGASAQAWTASSLPPERQAWLWSKAALTGRLLGVFAAIILLVYLLRALFG